MEKMKAGTNQIQELRQITNAPILSCKKALEDANGDIKRAQGLLREWGAAVMSKRSARTAQEGIIASYIHNDNKLGVLVELNCESDFVARTEEFQKLGKEIAMQVAASDPHWVSISDIPQDVLAREKEIYTNQAKKEGKEEEIAQKIAEGRLKKFYAESCLLEQPYIRDANLTVAKLIDSVAIKIGEKIAVSKFSRLKVGEQ